MYSIDLGFTLGRVRLQFAPSVKVSIRSSMGLNNRTNYVMEVTTAIPSASRCGQVLYPKLI